MLVPDSGRPTSRSKCLSSLTDFTRRLLFEGRSGAPRRRSEEAVDAMEDRCMVEDEDDGRASNLVSELFVECH